MKPIYNWDSVARGYRFKQKTWYSTYHLGLDLITPVGIPVMAPFDGTSMVGSFIQGGNVVNYSANGYVFRFMHLSSIVKTGSCKAGDIIGYTGNSGTFTSGPHLHVDISKGSVQVNNINNFVDPDTFNWGEEGNMPTEAQVRAWDMAYYATYDDMGNNKVDYIANTRIGGGGDNIGDRVAKLEQAKPGTCNCGFTADDRKLLDQLKKFIKY